MDWLRDLLGGLAMSDYLPASHRDTGNRQWCGRCTEWCYPAVLCACCARPVLEWLLAEARWWAERATICEITNLFPWEGGR